MQEEQNNPLVNTSSEVSKPKQTKKERIEQEREWEEAQYRKQWDIPQYIYTPPVSELEKIEKRKEIIRNMVRLWK